MCIEHHYSTLEVTAYVQNWNHNLSKIRFCLVRSKQNRMKSHITKSHCLQHNFCFQMSQNAQNEGISQEIPKITKNYHQTTYLSWQKISNSTMSLCISDKSLSLEPKKICGKKGCIFCNKCFSCTAQCKRFSLSPNASLMLAFLLYVLLQFRCTLEQRLDWIKLESNWNPKGTLFLWKVL